MTIQQRTAAIERWGELQTLGDLDAWLAGREDHARSYLDEEVAQSIGWDNQVKHTARLSAYSEVRARIAPLVEAQAAERAATAHVDGIEAAFKSAYGPEPLAPWQAEGR